MSELPSVNSSQPRLIHVAAQSDHIESLARGRPISAIAELVWNALDADADQVQIKVEDNDLGNPELIEVADNGFGIDPSDAERAFGNLGGSRKRDRPYSEVTNKKLHGRDGKGRFKAFALGRKVEWDTVYLTDDGLALNYVIKGSASRLQDFEIGQVKPAEAGRPRGTRVRIGGIEEPLGVLASDGSGDRQLAELFALYLRNYPATRIIVSALLTTPLHSDARCGNECSLGVVRSATRENLGQRRISHSVDDRPICSLVRGRVRRTRPLSAVRR